MSALAELFLDESHGGHTTEDQMDEIDIPSVIRDDRRTTPKDKCTQNQESFHAE